MLRGSPTPQHMSLLTPSLPPVPHASIATLTLLSGACTAQVSLMTWDTNRLQFGNLISYPKCT
jgi:hypothetical protein